MATDDRQVLVTGTAPAPATFTIPGNGQVRPKTIFATFDGTNAASAFLPCIKITSDGGELVGVYPAPSVAAGGSAEASWFPGGNAGLASGQLLPVCNVFQPNVFTWTPSLVQARPILWPRFATTDAATFVLDVGSSTPKVERDGTYASLMWVNPNTNWPDATAGGPIKIGAWGGSLANEPTGIAPYSQYPDIDVFAPLAHGDTVNVWSYTVLSLSAGDRWFGGGMNFSGANFTGQEARAWVWRLGDLVEA